VRRGSRIAWEQLRGFPRIFVGQRRWPATLSTLPTDSFQFGVVIVGTAVLVGALTFFPAWALGPVVEHLRMAAGR